LVYGANSWSVTSNERRREQPDLYARRRARAKTPHQLAAIAGHAPIMTEVTQALLAKWDALAEPREADVAAAMMHTTSHIISRAMFSSDSDEIVDVVEADVNLYQSKVRATLADFLHLPQWLARLIAPFPTSGIFDEFDSGESMREPPHRRSSGRRLTNMPGLRLLYWPVNRLNPLYVVMAKWLSGIISAARSSIRTTASSPCSREHGGSAPAPNSIPIPRCLCRRALL